MRFAVALLVLIFSPAIAYGQACMGTPLVPHQIAAMGKVGFTEGATSYGGTLSAYAYPVIVSGGYALSTIDNIEPHMNHFSGSLAFEVPDIGFSACPFAGVGYSRISETVQGITAALSSLAVSGGFAIGADLPVGPSFSFIPYATPEFSYIRTNAAFDDIDSSESSNEFGATLGLTLSGGVAFAGGAVTLSTIDESEPLFSVGLGLATR